MGWQLKTVQKYTLCSWEGETKGKDTETRGKSTLGKNVFLRYPSQNWSMFLFIEIKVK